MPTYPLEVCHDAWIGSQTVITPGCRRIGLGSIVGAGAVLVRDVPDFAVVGGVPACVIKMRFSDETCERIRNSEWWKLSLNQCLGFLKEMMLPLDGDPICHPLLVGSQTQPERTASAP